MSFIWRGILGIAGVAVLVLGGSWVTILASDNPPRHPLAGLAWPVACSTRGCVTTTHWRIQQNLARSYAELADQNQAGPSATLQTAIRRHLISNAELRSPITQADAVRYREEVLHIVSEQRIRDSLDVSLAQYDTYVVIPLLRQEALRAQRNVEDTEELYAALADERTVIDLLWRFDWDTDTGEVRRD